MNPPTGPKAAWATDRAIRRFREMWAAGVSTQQMGNALGVTKNSIVGMRKTLNLPERPSPIARPEGWVPKWRPRVGKPNLAALDAPVERIPAPVIADAPRPVISAPTPRPTPSVITSGRGECCWLLGERPYRSCDQPTVGRQPYCPTHNARAYLATGRRHAAGTPAHATMGGDD